MVWHLNVDQPQHTRHPEPHGWGRTVTHTRQALALPDDLEMMSIAVHEAGHTALFLKYGIPVEYLAVYTEKEAQDKTGLGVTYRGAYSVEYPKIASALAAGERAQDRWLQQEGLWTRDRAWAVDRHAYHDREELATIVATQLGGTLTYGVDPIGTRDYQHICALADEAIAPMWTGVLALARDLARHRRLTGARARNILARVL